MTSVRTRLAIAHLVSIIVIFGLSAIAAYWTLARSVRGQLDDALLALAQTEEALLPDNSNQKVAIHDVNPGNATEFVWLDRLVQIVDARGNPLARSSNMGSTRLPADSNFLASLKPGRPVFQTLNDYREEPVRIVTLPVEDHGAVRAIQVAGSLDDVNNVIHLGGALLAATAIALFFASGIAGAYALRRAFKQIDDVVTQVQELGRDNPQRRLNETHAGDEVRPLIDTLNAMLERIENSLEAQRRFSADASHELRSPLSRLRTEIEIALRRTRSADEYRAVLASCLDEVAGLTRVVGNLLALSRIDASSERPDLNPISLKPLALAIVRRFRAVAAQRNIKFHTSAIEDAIVLFNEGFADVVISNLIDNALKFSPQGGVVSLAVRKQFGFAHFSVTDQGPGVPSDEVKLIFQRFFRGRSSTLTSSPGAGLGLALCKAIVSSHGGSIDIKSTLGEGAVFTIRMPLLDDPESKV